MIASSAMRVLLVCASLLWTSPDEEGPHVRDTSVVVGQLLSEARQSLWISTYSIFNGREVFLPIEEAWTVRPEPTAPPRSARDLATASSSCSITGCGLAFGGS